jgi:putative heme-binding domain-containing protein
MKRVPLLLAPLLALPLVTGAEDKKGEKAPAKTAFVSPKAPPSWIWGSKEARPNQVVFFRKEVVLDEEVARARLYASCDNELTLFIDGKRVARHAEWESPLAQDVTEHFLREPSDSGPRRHVLAVRGRNEAGPAGLLVRLVFETRARKSFAVVTDSSWRVSSTGARGWQKPDFDDRRWVRAAVVGKLGDAPWSAVNEEALARAARLGRPSATPAEHIKVVKGFKVELLYTVPKQAEGSWVSMCADPKGRLIVSDQYGPLYRVTPPPLGGKPEQTKVEKVDLPIGEAQGLLWAFDSLYVVVNRGEKYDSGLYRLRATGDKFTRLDLLRKIEGAGEHGPHAVLLAPDGKSLHVVCGNATKLMSPLAGSRVPRVWGEDHLLPRVPDGNGFMRDVLAPGGCVYKVSPDGKDWELVSSGFRNPYDLAFNRHGELFTYDADMEWDLNTPWYRPTRVCLVTSGSEYGWRNGAGKWPPYYPDSLPAVLDVGPGSPTGMVFGYGAKFPAKYQEALFMCDWSYGKLYAVHLTPEGSAYKAELEEFLSGQPLALTDVVVNLKDGALYFTIGGRRTQSGLYRVTYVGKESTAPARGDDRGAEARALRHKLEAFHGKKDPRAVESAWPYLGHPDRFVRFAARVAVEHQDPKAWRDRALAEKDPQSALTALLALVRVSADDPFHRKKSSPKPDPGLKGKVLAALERLDWGKLSYQQKLELLRVYGLVFNRLGRPDEGQRKRAIARFDPHYPAGGRELNAELCQLLVYLQAPDAARKTMALLAKAPTQEEQIEYARSLRVLKAGWTPALRKAYFSWFLKAGTFKGGASLGGFLRLIKSDAVATLTPKERLALKSVLEAKPSTTPVAVKPRPFVRKWKVDDLLPVVEKGLRGRDFDRGRRLFGEAQCFACHRFDNEGGSQGPDLTGVSGRFSPRDLLESIIEPSKEVSDQYAAVIITTTRGKTITGRVVNLQGDTLIVNTNMLDPNALEHVNVRQIESKEKSKVSMMPEGLLDTLREDEVLDLVAYLLSRGDRHHKMFKKAAVEDRRGKPGGSP